MAAEELELEIKIPPAFFAQFDAALQATADKFVAKIHAGTVGAAGGAAPGSGSATAGTAGPSGGQAIAGAVLGRVFDQGKQLFNQAGAAFNAANERTPIGQIGTEYGQRAANQTFAENLARSTLGNVPFLGGYVNQQLDKQHAETLGDQERALAQVRGYFGQLESHGIEVSAATKSRQLTFAEIRARRERESFTSTEVIQAQDQERAGLGQRLLGGQMGANNYGR